MKCQRVYSSCGEGAIGFSTHLPILSFVRLAVFLVTFSLVTLLCIGRTAIAQVGEEDCNQNEIPDICELDPESRPDLCLITQGPDTPAADFCPDAQEVSIGFFYTGNASGATKDGTANCGAASNSADVWYKFRNPPESEDGSSAAIEVKFSMSGTVSSPQGFDPVLTIYDGCPQTEGGILSCNDDSCGLDSVLTHTVGDGETIFIRIARFAGGPSGPLGTFRLNVLSTEAPSCIGTIGSGTDCNQNGRLDACDVVPEFGGNDVDCNHNERPDTCDIAEFNGTQVGEETVNLDINNNGLIDICEDCNRNAVPDACDVNSVDPTTVSLWQVDGSEPFSVSCESLCGAAGPGGAVLCGLNPDANANLRPDQCEPDCNGNGVPDSADISSGVVVDCNANGRPDSCDLQSPLVGTGFYSPLGLTRLLDENYTSQANDMFYLLYPNAAGAGRELVGPIGTVEFGAKDIAVNPVNGSIVAVGISSYLNSKEVGFDEQNLYTIDRHTGAGVPLSAPVTAEGGILGLTFNGDGSVAYGAGFAGTFTVDAEIGGPATALPMGVGGIGLATSSSGEIYSLIPQTLIPSGQVIDQECISGLVQRIDASSGEVLEEQFVVDQLIDLCEGGNAGGEGEGECLVCRQLQDIAFGADGTFYGVTAIQNFDDGLPPVLPGSIGNDLVRLVPFIPGTPPPGPTPSGSGGSTSVAEVGFVLETVGPLFLSPAGLGGGLPPESADCDSNSEPDECQADCDADGIPDACDETTGIDACGVCLGDGSTCACTESSLVAEQASLDGSALELKETVHLAAHTLEQKSRNNRRNRRFARDVRRKATQLYTQIWTLTWGQIPSTITTCTEAAQCATVSNEPAVQQYQDLMNALRQLLTDVTKRMNRIGVRRKKTKRLNATGDAQLATAFLQISQIPLTSSNCN